MFKIIIAFIFLVAFAAQTFQREFIVFDYFANKAAYAKNCENKAKPKMHCNGKCQVMKKLKEEEKKEEQNAERKVENKNEIVLSSKSFYPTVSFFVPVLQTLFSTLTPGRATEMPHSLLRPPIC